METIAQRHALHEEALRLLRKERIDEAVRAAEEACRIDPKQDESARLLAVCYLTQHRFQAAFELFVRLHDRG